MTVDEFRRQVDARWGVLPADRPVYILLGGLQIDIRELGVRISDDAAVILIDSKERNDVA